LGLGMASAPTTKKRKTREDDVSFVELPRDQLLTMSSVQLEDNIRSLTAVRSLTSAEQREIKRQRRLIKNREYAQTSRVKKKQFVEELRQENDLLKDRLRILEEENHFLRFGGSAPHPPYLQPVHREQTMVVTPIQQNRNFYPTYQENSYSGSYQQQQQNYSSPHSSMSSSNPESPRSTVPNSSASDHSSEEVEVFEYQPEDFLFPRMEEQTSHVPYGSLTGTFCLMIILFSFAVFLPNFLLQGNSVPNVVFEQSSNEMFRTSRYLMSLDPSEEKPQPLISTNISNSTSRSQPITVAQVLEEEFCYTKEVKNGVPAACA